MKPFTVALVGVTAFLGVIPGFGAAAAAQSTTTRLAYDQCAPDLDVFAVVCSVHVVVEGSWILIAPGVAPRWSPEGARVAFTESAEIVVGNLADGTLTNLSNHPAIDMWPAWSPDGRIAFVSDRDGGLELYVMNGDGSNVVRLTTNVGFLGQFVWSPDGGRIALARDTGGSSDLFVMNADGSDPIRFTYGSRISGQVVWSRDGQRLAFACEIETGNSDICTIRADGTNLTRATNDAAFDSEPTFSAADGRIAFSSGGRLAVVELDGTVSPIGVEGSQPAWLPDGKQLTFIGTTVTWMGRCYFGEGDGAHNADDFCVPVSDIYIINADGTGLALIANGADVEWFTPLRGQPVAAFTSECSGSTCGFDASGSHASSAGTIASYAWQFGDGTIGSGATPGHTYAPGGWYTATLTVTDDGGTVGVLSKRVYANASPVPSFTVTCNGPTCNFDGSASLDPDGTIKWYYWLFGDGESGEGSPIQPTITHTFATGTFSARLIVSDGATTATQTQTLSIVNALPVASFTVTCSTLTCKFDATASADSDGRIDRVWWQFGDGVSRFDDRPVTYTYRAAGAYTVILTVLDNAQQSAIHTQIVTVVASAPPVASFTAACTELACSFDASGSSDTDGVIASYAWNFADGSTGWGVNVSHAYLAAGTYTVTLVVTDNGGATSTQARSVTVVPPEMHVGDLDASSTMHQRSWSATVVIEIHDRAHGPIGGVAVSASWNDGSPASCTTNTSGRCAVTKSQIPKKTSVSLTVTGAAHGTFVYNPAANHDATGDSSGTTIRIARQ